MNQPQTIDSTVAAPPPYTPPSQAVTAIAREIEQRDKNALTDYRVFARVTKEMEPMIKTLIERTGATRQDVTLLALKQFLGLQ